MATNKRNELDTTYATNLRNNQGSIPTAQQTAQGASINNNQNSNVNIDTSYQANSGALYGGHTASWWQQQYGSADNDSKEMIRKAADYYGYQIPEAVSQSGTPIPSNNQVPAAATNLNYSANVRSLSTPVEQTTTGQTNTTANQETTDTPIDSYEEFLKKQAEGYQETLDKTNQYIDEQEQSTIDRAEAERERNIADANSSYALNRAGYGANAETLASMGLTGSGYSDYLDQQAYATQRAEVQAANVQSESTKLEAEQQANADRLNAQLTYDQNMAQNEANLAEYQLQQEEQRKAAYAELLTYANNGTYSEQQIEELGAQYGLNDDQVKLLTDAAKTYKENQQNATYYELLGSVDTSGFESLKSALDSGSITQAQYESLRENYQTYYYDMYTSSISSDFTAVNTEDIDNAVNKGHITKVQYDNLKQKYNESLASSISAAFIFYANGVQLDEQTARSVVDELKNTGWLTDENKNKLDSLLESTYKEDEGGGCYAKGTLITVADGSQVPVEDLKVGDVVKVFNHNTGRLDNSAISYIFYDGEKEYDVLNLTFSNNTSIEVLFGHSFFDIDSRKYVLINNNTVEQYLGHNFYFVSNENGGCKNEIVSLIDYKTYKKATECFAVLTAEHINSFANGLLNITDDENVPSEPLRGFTNIFELDSNYKYDQEKMKSDINKYGLFSYNEWKDYVTEEQFNAFNGSILKVAIGKGLISMEELQGYINKFLKN